MRSYLNIIPFIFYSFNALFSIFHTESLVKMSNSLWFSKIFTLQSSSWSCFNYSFWLFHRCIWKDYYESEKFFITIELKNFQNFSFSFLKYINFKIITNSFKYSLVEQFFETHFLKSNYRGVRGVYFLKNLVNFFGFIYPPYLGCGGVYYTSNNRAWDQPYSIGWANFK